MMDRLCGPNNASQISQAFAVEKHLGVRSGITQSKGERPQHYNNPFKNAFKPIHVGRKGHRMPPCGPKLAERRKRDSRREPDCRCKQPSITGASSDEAWE